MTGSDKTIPYNIITQFRGVNRQRILNDCLESIVWLYQMKITSISQNPKGFTGFRMTICGNIPYPVLFIIP